MSNVFNQNPGLKAGVLATAGLIGARKCSIETFGAKWKA